MKISLLFQHATPQSRVTISLFLYVRFFFCKFDFYGEHSLLWPPHPLLVFCKLGVGAEYGNGIYGKLALYTSAWGMCPPPAFTRFFAK